MINLKQSMNFLQNMQIQLISMKQSIGALHSRIFLLACLQAVHKELMQHTFNLPNKEYSEVHQAEIIK